MLEDIHFRRALPADLPALAELHRASLLGVARTHYSEAQILGLFDTVATADPELVATGTCLVAEHRGRLVASGGWSRRPPAYEAGLPGRPAGEGSATIRAHYVHPDYTRRHLARTILEAVESEAVLVGGAERIDLVATLSAAPFYRAMGYAPGAPVMLELANGLVFPGRWMSKHVTQSDCRAA